MTVLTGPVILPLRTPRLLLRVMRPTDAATVATYRADPEVARYQDWELPYSLDRAHTALAAQDDLDDVTPGRWVQVALETADGALVGDLAVGLDATGAVATLGWTLPTAHQGHGYATEAAGALIAALFDGTGVHRVQATMDPDNEASLRLAERLGLREEGLSRRSVPIRGEWLDDRLVAVLRPEHAAWVGRPRTPPAAVTLVEVTADNLGAVRALATFGFQERFVAPMAASLAQALVPGTENGHPVVPWFRAIAADGEVVGFVMLAAAGPGRPDPYLWRLLIDRAHQQRGIGRRALAELTRTLRAAGHTALLVSWVDGPGGPRPFYERLGFVPTGELDGDEIVARLGLDAPAG